MGSDNGTVAVVTGGARGIGRGIALVLGATGATVYVTDRESRAHTVQDLPGTVEDTAEQVTDRGGRGIAVPLDHTDDRAVAALFARVRAEHGGLDLLVANATAGNALPFHSGAFWTLPLAHWHNMIDCGVRGHLVAAHCAAPLLIEHGRGLLVLTGYDDPGAEVIGGHVFYDLAMTATSRLARTLAHDLRPHGVTALAVSPGITRTEAIAAAVPDMPPGTDSVEFAGRAVRALLADPDVARHAGRTIAVADLAAEYGFTDIE
ncbi:NAD(P)-dependent dehydrogenase (short-subunit alcohol dehydrogenase family) [Murinocardiopsis flavida]|uniref:NAD(P)-dependent dehydrogenase (Short-subunit alcohol dehydrogenase family) n=1 Tax=Murinocardiopsis flavida TaxID=645275 RepID=A0A2P8CZ43_9ACTN|nr:SDR family NAD(P)-dependent oxidoreductase [Murinocardiopsis flavida]PSK90234.1 NAD(P)-dependent dehydrogenase (short-subunit alcohol dehydrogenase family) [Murinocardiopsis flavida]